MKSILRSLCAFLALAAFASAARAETVENPSYAAWSKFKPGSSSTYKGANDVGGRQMEMSVTQKLVDSTPEVLTVEISTTAMMNGQQMPVPAQKLQLKKMVDKADIGKPGTGFDPDLLKNATEESVTVPAGTFKAKKVEFDREQGQLKIHIITWYSTDVPGGAVKMDLSSDQQGGMHNVMELQSTESK